MSPSTFDILTQRPAVEPLAPPPAPKAPAGGEPFEGHLQRASREQSPPPAKEAEPRRAAPTAGNSADPPSQPSENESEDAANESVAATNKPVAAAQRRQSQQEETPQDAAAQGDGEVSAKDSREEAEAAAAKDLLELTTTAQVLPTAPVESFEKIELPDGAAVEGADAEVVTAACFAPKEADAEGKQKPAPRASAAKKQTGEAKLEASVATEQVSDEAASATGAPATEEPTVANEDSIELTSAQSKAIEDAGAQPAAAVVAQDNPKPKTAAARKEGKPATVEPTAAENAPAEQTEAAEQAVQPTTSIEARSAVPASERRAPNGKESEQVEGQPVENTSAGNAAPPAPPSIAGDAPPIDAAADIVSTDAVAAAGEGEGVESSKPDAANKPAELAEQRAQQAGRLGGGRAPQGEGRADQLTHAERVRFVQRVSNAFQMAQERGGEVRLRLAPPELGPMKLEIQLEKGVLTAKIEVENSAARTVLLDNMPALRERLSGQEIKIGSFDIDLMDRPHDGPREQMTGDFQRSPQERRPAVPARRDGGDALESPKLARAVRTPDNNQLNIVI